MNSSMLRTECSIKSMVRSAPGRVRTMVMSVSPARGRVMVRSSSSICSGSRSLSSRSGSSRRYPTGLAAVVSVASILASWVGDAVADGGMRHNLIESLWVVVLKELKGLQGLVVPAFDNPRLLDESCRVPRIRQENQSPCSVSFPEFLNSFFYPWQARDLPRQLGHTLPQRVNVLPNPPFVYQGSCFNDSGKVWPNSGSVSLGVGV